MKLFILKLFKKIVIPKGQYCYKIIKHCPPDKKYNLPYLKTKICPFWGMDKNKLPQDNGYCNYLNINDWDYDGIGLLWDQCKLCDINIGE